MTHIFQENIFIVTTVALVSYTGGFLLPNDCHVVPKCDCSPGNDWYGIGMAPSVGVFCQGRHFFRVPTFQNVSYKMSRPWTIDLQLNYIFGLPDNAFSKLQAYGNNNNVSVLLGNNGLRNEHVSDSAFSGIENLVVALSLFSNHLTSIPPFVTRLTHLEALNIQSNRIIYIDSSILISIRGTLKILRIDIDSFSYSTSGQPVQNLSVVCQLKYLEILDIKIASAQDLSEDIMINCTMNSTTELNISGYNHHRFPDVFKSFPNIENITVSGHELQYIDDSLIPAGTRVKLFRLYNTKLQTIPAAINLLSLLEQVVLAYNDINTVESHSFDNLHHLNVIILRGNPIIYISRSAFRNLFALQYLALDETKITTIPPAVETLPNLIGLQLGDIITCTCQSWMKKWSLSVSAKRSFNVDGNCRASNETLHDFVFNTLPNCP